ncbi:MAG: 3-deoxy-7-phosphoheptulonate synthase [Actinomycetota bacterium]
MMIIMREGATEEDIQHIVERVEDLGIVVHISKGTFATVLGLVGDTAKARELPLATFSGVERVVPIMKPFKLVGREFHPDDTIVDVGKIHVGGNNFTVIAGPCSVEDHDGYLEIARFIKKTGAQCLRGGAFKPRSSPYSFQGLGEDGLKIMAEARDETGLPIVTEVMDARDVELVDKYADVLQIGARNMQNFTLLKEVGGATKPVMVKRGLSSTIEEFLMAAEYVISSGNGAVILCERGIRTFETYTRNTLDLSCVPLVKKLSHLPIIVDPSHGAGRWDIVEPLSIASVAVGAHGIMIEVHPRPEEALSDGYESLKFDNFANLMKNVKQAARVFGKGM